MRRLLLKLTSAAALLVAAFSVVSAEDVLVDTSQALVPVEYKNALVRDVACFDADGDCYFVVTGSMPQNSEDKNYLSVWKSNGTASAEKLAALSTDGEFFRLVSHASGEWLSLFVETINSPPSVYIFNKADKTFTNVSELVGRHGALDKLKGAKVTSAGALALLYDSASGCCDIHIVDIKSGKILGQEKLEFVAGKEISPLDFAVVPDGYALAGALSDTPEKIGAVGISGKKGNELTTMQGKERYYFSVDAGDEYLYAVGNSLEFGGGVLSAFLSKQGESPALVAEKFSKSAGSRMLSFGHLCAGFSHEAFTDQNSKPYQEFELVVAPILERGTSAGSSDYQIATSSPLAFTSVFTYVQRNQLFVVINAQEFDEVTRGFNNRIYQKKVAEFALCAND
jgi:hypothetical protein